MLRFHVFNGFSLLLLLSIMVYDYNHNISVWNYAWIFVGWFIVVSLASFSMPMRFFLTPFTHHYSTQKKIVALTFDDGPHPEYTLPILELLKRYNATATFFCIGKKGKQYPEILKQIVKDGHDIGNHSFTHGNTIDFKNTEGWITEITKTNIEIEKATGLKTKMFRPPYGVTTPNVAKAIKMTGHTVIGWNVRSFDTVLQSPDRIFKRIKNKIKPGAVILMHDTHKNSGVVLEHLLQFLQEHTYTTVLVKDLIQGNE